MKNKAIFCAMSLLHNLLLLMLDGAILQTFLIECGFSEEATGLFFSLMKLLQVAVILLFSQIAERVRRVKRAIALHHLALLPLSALLLALARAEGTEGITSAILLYLAGTLFCVAIGVYNILYYKLPYSIMDMAGYGRVCGIAGAIGGGATFLLSLLLAFLQGRHGFFPVMRIAYLFAACLTLLAVPVTLALRESPVSTKGSPEASPARLLTYRPFTLLILPNLARGFGTGVIGVIVTVGYAAGRLDAASASWVAVVTGGVGILGSLAFASLTSRQRPGRLLLLSGVAIALLLPLSVLSGSTAAFLTLYGIAYFFVTQVDNAVPVAVTRFVDYGMISRYTGGRMLLHTLGISLGGFASVGICRLFGPFFLMLLAAAAILAFVISYYLYLKKFDL